MNRRQHIITWLSSEYETEPEQEVQVPGCDRFFLFHVLFDSYLYYLQ